MSTDRNITVSKTRSDLGRDTGPEFTASYRLRDTNEFIGSGDFSRDSLTGNDPEDVPLPIHTASVEFKIENYDSQNPGGGTLLCTNQFTASICDTPVHLIEENVEQTRNQPYKIKLKDLNLGETEPESLDIFISRPDANSPIQAEEELSIEESIELNLNNEEFNATEDFTISIRKRCDTGRIDGGKSFPTPTIEVTRNNNEVSKPRNITLNQLPGTTLTVSWNKPLAEDENENQPDNYKVFLIVDGTDNAFQGNEVPGDETTINIDLCDITDIIPQDETKSVHARVESIYESDDIFNGIGTSDNPVSVEGCVNGNGEGGTELDENGGGGSNPDENDGEGTELEENGGEVPE